jgi:hypothetical protein
VPIITAAQGISPEFLAIKQMFQQQRANGIQEVKDV